MKKPDGDNEEEKEKEADRAAEDLESVLGWAVSSHPGRMRCRGADSTDIGAVQRIEEALFDCVGSSSTSDIVAVDDSIGDGDGEDDGDRDEWAAGLTLLRDLLKPPPPSLPWTSVENRDSGADGEDARGGYGRSLVPPHLLLRSVADASLSLDDGGGSGGTEDAAALLSVLAFAALRSESLRALSSSSSCPAVGPGCYRWRRFQSVAFESVALYQRIILGSFASRGWRWSREDLPENLRSATELLARHLVPSCRLAAEAMAVGAGEGRGVRPDLLVVGAVSSALKCADLIGTHDDEDSGVAESSGGRRNDHLLHEAAQSVGDLASCAGGSVPLVTVLLHPVRSYYYRRRKRQQRVPRDDIGYWVCDRAARVGGEEDEESCYEEEEHDDNNDEHRRDVLCGMDSEWDGTGLSRLAVHVLLDESPRPLLPRVYSPPYLFALLYPHVVASLERALEASRSDDDFDEETEVEQSSARRRAAGSRGVQRAVGALRALLTMVPTLRWGDKCRCQGLGGTYLVKLLKSDVDGPLSPGGCVQILLNLLVALSNQSGGGEYGENDSGGADPSPGEILGVVRALLGLYAPPFVVQCIEVLLDRCPYPSLEPLLLDLLRPALLSPPLPKTAAASTGEDPVVENVLRILQPYFDRMEGHCGVVEVAQDDDAGNVEHSHARIADMEGLLGSAEVFTCAAALVRLVALRTRQRSGSTAFSSGGALSDVGWTARDLRSCLAAEFGRWSASGAGGDGGEGPDLPPEGHHRLFLLEDALGEVARPFAA